MVHPTSVSEPSLSPVTVALPPTPGRWKRNPGSVLQIVRFDHNHVLFNPASGSTHLVNDLILDILDALAHEPAGGLELAQRLQLEAGEDGTLLELERILQNLDQLGLITPVDL
ncbi:MAG: HPr-rel-A system PqqD family peptide chaperone [Magnetococcales bacterium]|nr:HPr-rel-A system PqqD family peptide chaperone [Magnetococcales bacterium]